MSHDDLSVEDKQYFFRGIFEAMRDVTGLTDEEIYVRLAKDINKPDVTKDNVEKYIIGLSKEELDKLIESL